MLLFVLCLTLTAQAAPVWQKPSWQEFGVLLKGSSAKGLLNQCSRAAPERVSAQWTPSSQQIGDMEARLPAFKRSLNQLRLPLNGFYRQYAGFVAGGRQIIYVNLFPKRSDSAWRSEPYVVCDGGSDHWGVEFEVATKQFVNSAFNGG